VLAYAVWPPYLRGGAWTMPLWARLAEYLPVLLLGLWEVTRCRLGLSFPPATKPTLCLRS
jgi:hypothetical protein